MKRVYNFSAGPAVLPEEVLAECARDMSNYNNSGMSVMEISHRSEIFDKIIKDAEEDLRKLLDVPNNYKILFLQGGASQQFAMVPMNLMENKKADFIITGLWAKKAFEEAGKYGDCVVLASSEDKNFSYIPNCNNLPIRKDSDYVYICENNTIYGTKFKELPNTKGKVLVTDQSSCFLSEPIDVSKYGLIFAGVQKNVGPAGMVVVIIREDLVREDISPFTPTILKYKTHVESKSLYNTPNCWCVYVCGLVFKYLLQKGGLQEMKKQNEEKARILYDYLDNSKLFLGTAEKGSRSIMNVPFVINPVVITNQEQRIALEEKFITEAKRYGLENLRGHRSIGGMRASIYNAMPIEGVLALVNYMKEFEEENQ